MVYIPYEVVKRHMHYKWRKALEENPGLPAPTTFEVNVQWFKWLDWVPDSGLDLDRFKQMFPGEAHKIQYREIKEFTRQQPSKRRPEPTPIAGPLGEEPQ